MPLVCLELDGPVAVVSLNNPERHNAMGDKMDEEFFSILESLRTNKSISCVIWRGNGKSFSSGRDLADLGVRIPGVSDFDVIERGHYWTKLLYEFPVPIICALKGWVLGGQFERAMLCDIRVAGESSKLALPELEHGVITDSGGLARLVEIGGHSLALDLVLTGRRIDAQEALQLGIVSRVVPDDELDKIVLEMAHTIASRPKMAVRMIRENVQSLTNPDIVALLKREIIGQSFVFANRSIDIRQT